MLDSVNRGRTSRVRPRFLNSSRSDWDFETQFSPDRNGNTGNNPLTRNRNKGSTLKMELGLRPLKESRTEPQNGAGVEETLPKKGTCQSCLSVRREVRTTKQNLLG